MMRKNLFFPVLAILLFLAGCQATKDDPLVLVSKNYTPNLLNWLQHADPDVSIVNMYTVSEDSIAWFLGRADGILISGGPDVNPALYGKGDEIERCGEIDYRRDSLEFRMISHAMENDVPLIGICRGNQIMNVFNRGSLIIDIPTDRDTLYSHRLKGKHPVRIVEGTLLSEIIIPDSGMVNSRHHQAVEMLAPGFIASAYASDGIIEAIEPAGLSVHPFILGIQWHPESMVGDPDTAFALPLARSFMQAVHARMN